MKGKTGQITETDDAHRAALGPESAFESYSQPFELTANGEFTPEFCIINQKRC